MISVKMVIILLSTLILLLILLILSDFISVVNVVFETCGILT